MGKMQTEETLSYGAGCNTAAMAAKLIENGWRGPIAFADTGSEKPETYCHIHWMQTNVFKPASLELTWLSWKSAPPEVIELAQKELHDKRVLDKSLEEFCLERFIIPLRTVRWCSAIFKRALLEAWRVYIGAEVSLIGLDAGERRRLRDDPHVCYPLVEWGWRRKDCIAYLVERQIPVPPKSSCFFCPNQTAREFRELWRTHPDLYERSAALERNVIGRSVNAKLRDDFSLDEWRRRFEAEIPMDLGEQSVTNYCICGL